MTFDELEELERKEKRIDPRETRRLIPIDTHSQIGTEYTGRPEDTRDPELDPRSYEEKQWRRQH